MEDDLWIRKVDRERRARAEAERLLETKSLELFESKQQVEQQLEELQTVHAALAETQGQLLQSEKLASMGQLAAGVAHEINNPIGFITSNLTTLSDYLVRVGRVVASLEAVRRASQQWIDSGGSDAVGRDRLQALCHDSEALMKETDFEYLMGDLGDLLRDSIDGTERVRAIVEDLRDFSHVDKAEVDDEDVNVLLDKAISVMSNELHYKVTLVREYDDQARIRCFGGRLSQVFLNLLMNAVQAIETHGTITVRTIAETDELRIEVQDTGAGIPKDILSRIYDPFFTTKDVGKGTGLGLNVVHQIIESHGGRIDVESELGEGTLFRIFLPFSGPPSAVKDQAA